MPYKNNFGTNDWPEFQQWANADSVNGRTGSMSPGARTNQATQSQPNSTTDSYQAYRNTAASWGFPQAAGPSPSTSSSSPYTASSLAHVLTGNSFRDDQDPPVRPHDPSDPSSPSDPTGDSGSYTPLPHPTTPPHGVAPPPTAPPPAPAPTAPPPAGVPPGPTAQITPHPPPAYPSVGALIKSLQGLNEPLFQQEQADYSRASAAQAAHSGAINSGGYPVAYERGLSDLINKENAGLSNEAFTADQNNLGRALQQYGIDINDKQFWGNLALKAYQGDQQAQQFYAYLVSQLGLTPAQIANIIGGFTPGVVFNPNP